MVERAPVPAGKQDKECHTICGVVGDTVGEKWKQKYAWRIL